MVRLLRLLLLTANLEQFGEADLLAALIYSEERYRPLFILRIEGALTLQLLEFFGVYETFQDCFVQAELPFVGLLRLEELGLILRMLLIKISDFIHSLLVTNAEIFNQLTHVVHLTV